MSPVPPVIPMSIYTRSLPIVPKRIKNFLPKSLRDHDPRSVSIRQEERKSELILRKEIGTLSGVEIQKSNAVPKILAVIFVAGLILSNYYLIVTSDSKLEFYRSEPPFLRFDFTDSYLEDRSSQAPYIADGNLSTEWRKLRPSSREWDFDAELRLSHRLKEGIYQPTPWKRIRVIACSRSAPPLSLRVLEREAINVDKESRLPDDTEYRSVVLDFSRSGEAEILLQKQFSPVPKSEYPKGIVIWAVQGSFSKIGKESCIKDIEISEE